MIQHYFLAIEVEKMQTLAVTVFVFSVTVQGQQMMVWALGMLRQERETPLYQVEFERRGPRASSSQQRDSASQGSVLEIA